MSSLNEINLNSIKTETFDVDSEFPSALVGGTAFRAKTLAASLESVRVQLPDNDRYGRAVVGDDIDLKINDYDDFIRDPGTGYKLIFNINTRENVRKVKSLQSTTKVTFRDNNRQGITAIVLKGSTQLSQAQLDANCTYNDLQKTAVIMSNAIVKTFLDDRNVYVMIPQARARFSDECVRALTNELYGTVEKPMVAKVIKAINFSTLKKPSQAIANRHYDASLSVANVLYGMVGPNAKEETMKIGKETIKKIITAGGVDKMRTTNILSVMFENSGSNSATTDELVEEAERMVARLAVPRVTRLQRTVDTRTGITAEPSISLREAARIARDEMIEKAKRSMYKFEREGRSFSEMNPEDYITLRNMGLIGGGDESAGAAAPTDFDGSDPDNL